MTQPFFQLVSGLVKQPPNHTRFVFVQDVEGFIHPYSDALIGSPDAEYPGYIQAFSTGFILAAMSGVMEGDDFKRRLACLIQVHNRGILEYATV